MKTAEQVLKEKGYDFFEISDIINHKSKYSEEGFDMQVRTEFGLQNEPLHLWEAYYRGDASEDILQSKADELKKESIDTLLFCMDQRLIELCEKIEERNQELNDNELYYLEP